MKFKEWKDTIDIDLNTDFLLKTTDNLRWK